ncbi:MAG: hypothetical protein GW861_01020 [Deltaproteobacteria bacterium]|nr:hypothetical protein [Deltaproteobacteria bacterium]
MKEEEITYLRFSPSDILDFTWDKYQRKVSRLNHPVVIAWALTHACDLRCIHCVVEAGEPAEYELSTEEAFMAIDNMAEAGKIDEVQAKRIEQELGLIFKDEVEKVVFAGLKGTGKKRQYIESIRAGKIDPYSLVKEVLSTFLKVEGPKRTAITH